MLLTLSQRELVFRAGVENKKMSEKKNNTTLCGSTTTFAVYKNPPKKVGAAPLDPVGHGLHLAGARGQLVAQSGAIVLHAPRMLLRDHIVDPLALLQLRH